MPWYVALVALLNIGVGYALAVYMQRARGTAVLVAGDDLDADLA